MVDKSGLVCPADVAVHPEGIRASGTCVEAGSVDSKPAVQVDAEYDDGDLPTVDDVNFRAFDAGDPIAAALEDATALDENVPANANVGGDIAVNA